MIHRGWETPPTEFVKIVGIVASVGRNVGGTSQSRKDYSAIKDDEKNLKYC